MTSLAQHLTDALTLGSFYALFALGIALIFGIMRLLNFAHGELIMVGAYTIYLTQDLPWYAITAVTLVTVVTVSLITERVAFRPVRGASDGTLLITSFAVSFLLQSLARLIFTTLPKSADIDPLLRQSADVGGVTVGWLSIITLAVTATLLVGVGWFLRSTDLGMQMRAAAEDFRAAQLCGVDANRVIATAFALSGVLAAMAALLIVGQTGSITPTMGLTPVLFGFTAAVIGGMGSLPGAIVGGYALGAASTAMTAALPADIAPFRDAFLFALVFAVLFLRPEGLLRARGVTTRV